MTKEEILAKHYPDFDEESGWMFDGPVSEVFKAMDEYAKQQSIEFAKFIVDGTWDNVAGDYDGIVSFEKEPDELYNLFLQQTQGE